MNILVVEDDHANANLIEKLLNQEGYRVDIAPSYATAVTHIDTTRYRLIVLDWNLPDGDGYALLQETRALLIDASVLMLSANADVSYRVKALNSGADDYLCKPYSQAEFLARVKSLLRRSDSNKNTTITVGAVTLCKNSREVTTKGDVVALTSTEYNLLELLASNPNKIFTKHELLDAIHTEYDTVITSNVIEVHVKNIRKKLHSKEIIATVRSIGYKIGC